METVKFITIDESASKDMSADFGCILAHKEVGAPGVKSKFIDVPFRSGSLDTYKIITDTPIYDNREIKIDFLYLGSADKNVLLSQIYDFIHGRELWVQLSDDFCYYYRSRVTSIENVVKNNQKLSFRIVCKCDPYKYDINNTLVDWEWDTFDLEDGIINDVGELVIEGRTTATFTLVCRKKRAFPTITTDRTVNVKTKKTDGEVYTSQIARAGTNKLYELVFYEGENTVEIFNSSYGVDAHVTFEYRGEKL